MQSNRNVETIRNNAGAFTESDAFRVLRRRSHKARQCARNARRAMKAAALCAFLVTGGAASAASLPPIGLDVAMRAAASGSNQAFCGKMWKAEKSRLSAVGYDWAAYFSACISSLKGGPGVPSAKAAANHEKRTGAKAAGAICSTDSDCERVTGRPVSLAPVTAGE